MTNDIYSDIAGILSRYPPEEVAANAVPLLQELFPSLHIYDGNEGTLNNLCSILKERDMLTERKEKGRTTFICSDEQLDFAARARKYIKER